MENKEWLNDYPALKQVAKTNPFTVPVSYFEELGQRITASIRVAELKDKMPLDGFTVPANYFDELKNNIQSRVNIQKALGIENTGFAVPENYFEDLTSNIQSRIFIDEALNTEHTGFTVPENYFEDLSSNIRSRVFVEEALNMKHTGFTVPENYFEELSSQITSRIFVEEALAQTDESFNVPANYFNQLNANILNKTLKQDVVKRKAKKGKVVSMFSSTAFKYATAACLLVMVGTGVLMQTVFSPTAIHNRTYLHKELSKVPVNELQEYLELNADEVLNSASTEAESASVDNPELDNALQNNANGTQK